MFDLSPCYEASKITLKYEITILKQKTETELDITQNITIPPHLKLTHSIPSQFLKKLIA
jgi:hypothetical protein